MGRVTLRTGKSNGDWYNSKPRRAKIFLQHNKRVRSRIMYERSGVYSRQHALYFHSLEFGRVILRSTTELLGTDYKKNELLVEGIMGRDGLIKRYKILEIYTD